MYPPRCDPALFVPSVEPPKEERPELQKKTYKWNTKEEAKQAFKELLKEKVSRPAGLSNSVNADIQRQRLRAAGE